MVSKPTAPHRPVRLRALALPIALLAAWPLAGGCRAMTDPLDLAAAGPTDPLSLAAAGPTAAPSAPRLPQPAWWERMLWPGRARWRSWADAHLQTGDLVFVRSNYYVMLGTFNLSRFLAEVGQSPFSHVGIVVADEGAPPMVYDISDPGIQSQPFAHFLTSGSKQLVAVRRPIGPARAAIPAAIQYVRDQHQADTPFDRRFQPGDDRLYCTELILEAYRRGGVELAPATAAGELPGLQQVGAVQLQLVRLATGLESDDPVILPGDAHSGLYGSPWLRTILEPTEL